MIMTLYINKLNELMATEAFLLDNRQPCKISLEKNMLFDQIRFKTHNEC